MLNTPRIECSELDCARNRYADGLCEHHHFVRHATPMPRTACSRPGCTKSAAEVVIPLCDWHAQSARRYGLTRERYVELLSGPCACCLVAPAAHIDHDHACCPGKRSCGACVRAGLCASCNLAAGWATGQNLTRVLRARAWLDSLTTTERTA